MTIFSRWVWLIVLGCMGIAYTAAAQEATPDDLRIVPDISEALEQSAGETGPDTFYRARVREIVSAKTEEVDIVGVNPFTQVVRVELLDGERQGETAELTYSALQESQLFEVDDYVVVIEPGSGSDTRLYMFDRYRLPGLMMIATVFAGMAVLLAGWRGVGSLVGLAFSVYVIVQFVVPSIMAGRNPLLVSFSAAVGIASVSIYLAHGFSRRTTLALIGMLITVGLALGISSWFVGMAGLSGASSEEAYYLQLAPTARINLHGLLLGAIIIGALGVLDDVATAQAAAVDELSKANQVLPPRELFRRGMAIGREHITSLVNTLVLAYVGASFPTLLLFTVYERPWWVVVNSEVVAEEIVRTVVGSLALMLAVPITTALAAYFLRRDKQSGPKDLVSA